MVRLFRAATTATATATTDYRQRSLRANDRFILEIRAAVVLLSQACRGTDAAIAWISACATNAATHGVAKGQHEDNVQHRHCQESSEKLLRRSHQRTLVIQKTGNRIKVVQTVFVVRPQAQLNPLVDINSNSFEWWCALVVGVCKVERPEIIVPSFFHAAVVV